MSVFLSFIAFIVVQRLVELKVASQNEKWMKAKGGIEFGQKHYYLMVGIHTLFFLSYLFEVIYFQKNISTFWQILLGLFIFTQLGRAWALMSLGRFWNTKIIVLPNAKVVMKGPYRFMKHPNYVVVTLEFLIIPLFYQAYLTAIVFSLLNLWILSIRIPIEERALRELTSYNQSFEPSRRFFSKI
ncbi:isoprenylcysteine carboxyl methyltransferase family protein [Bacillus sp. CGMCC 1.16607]|uniref:isoprenylcysteine carboxyl methyltransferase family protein n=1 Tax=Bacillus sp. CGMCC 1.16607 TaxID=3351842 RepID=UPI0036279747